MTTYSHKCGGKSTDYFNIENEESICRINPEANFETSMLGPLVILVNLVKRQIRHSFSKSGGIFGRPFMSPFLAIIRSLVIEI